jgi:membrane protein implicated in regulation of membrane protease activity
MDMYAFVLTPWFWLSAMIVFSLIELACSFNLVTIWFALSALIMVFVSGFTELFSEPIRFRLHIGLFLLLAIILLVFTRPVAIRKFKVGKTKTNVDELSGLPALVTQKITEFEKGQVKIKGQIWTAMSEKGEAIAEGTKCTVMRIEGVKVIVKPAQDRIETH